MLNDLWIVGLLVALPLSVAVACLASIISIYKRQAEAWQAFADEAHALAKQAIDLAQKLEDTRD